MAMSFCGHDVAVFRIPNLRGLLFFTLSCLWLLPAGSQAATVAGWVEQARLIPSGIDLKAKLDTGAKHSSVNAQSIVFFEAQGQEQVRFTVINKAGESVELTLPVERHATIKRHFGRSQGRPVVKLTICIGDLVKTAEVNLVDRAGFNYPLLIGRSFLAGDFYIDSAETFKLMPSCEQRSGQ
jgi:hypothetical protein